MEQLLNLLSNGKTQFHVAMAAKNILKDNGFIMLDADSEWPLVSGGKYMTMPFPSMLVAWVMGKSASSLRICAAHTDFPMLKLKSKPDISKKGYAQINVEPYGGLIEQTWFDRPLGIAGKVVLKGRDVFSPKVKLFDSDKPVCIIPNLAPHLRRDRNQDIDFQKELVPVIATCRTDDNKRKMSESLMLSYIADKLNTAPEDILDYDLYLYIDAKPSVIGINDELFAGARIDNISSVSAIIHGLCSYNADDCIAVGAFFDNEEIGSRSKQGADSILLREILDRILPDKRLFKNAFSLSIDVAHATHPNYTEKSDVTNDICLGQGVVLKSSASQRYVTDSEAGAVVTGLCRKNDIKLQRQVNRSGMPGGRTLGPIMSSYIPVMSADIGIPVLAMHSACELAHINDYKELVRLVTAYYSC